MPERSEAALYAKKPALRAPVGAAPRTGRQLPRLSGRNRYSLFVGTMKMLLPALAAALILLVFAWPQFTFKEERFRLGIARLSLDQAENLTMLNARYNGIDEQRQPYTITADMATQSKQDENMIDLELPKADMTLEGGAWLALTARTGKFNRAVELLDLTGSVSLFHDRGFELRSESAQIDLDAGTAKGHEPVQGQGTFGTVDAEGFRVLDSGQTIIFTGKSRLVLYPGVQEALQ
ncbi:MAG: LPS export ABC transporter periplasmic protein LptC [Alphaproteobacteria bacterium]